MCPEFHQAGGHNLRQMALLVALSHADGFFDLAFAQRAGDRGRERTRLLAGRVEGDVTVDHDADGPGRHDEQDDNYRFGQKAHVLPKRVGVGPIYAGVGGISALEKDSGGVQMGECDRCHISYKH